MVSNPLDALTTLALQLSGFPAGRVIGTGTFLDTMRLRVRLSQECGIHPNDLRVYVLGEHGDGQFVAASSATVGGAPLTVSPDRLRELEHETRLSGHQLLRQKGHTNHGIALAAAEVTEAIVTDRRSVMPVGTLVTGFAGVRGVGLSLPAVLGRGGVRQVLNVPLSADEVAAFRRCGEAVRRTMELFDGPVV